MDKIRRYFRNQGFNFAKESYYSFIDLWNNWYQGEVGTFHNYKVYNGQEYVDKKMKRLGMAKKICEDKAGFIINDRMCINLDKQYKDIIDNTLAENNFMVEISQLLEKTYALGTGAMVQFLDINDNVTIDYISAYNIIPLCYGTENRINKIAFVSIIDDETYYLNIHTLITDQTEPNYDMWKIENKKVKLSDDLEHMFEIELTGQELESGLYTTYYSPVPLFQLLKPNIANNIEIDSKLGISCFANALDQLQSVDMIYDSYYEEIGNGKSRVFVNEEMATIKFDENGQPQRYFDKRDTTFYSMKMGKDSTDRIIHDTPMLRTAQLSESITDMLSMLSFKVNLGNDYYDFKNGSVEKTATEVISENSDLYRQVKKDELVMCKVLKDLCRAILYLKQSDYTTDINIKFDDSIVIDDQQIMKDALLEFNSGLIDRIEYYKKVYRMTEEQAIKLNNEIEARKPKQDESELIDIE